MHPVSHILFTCLFCLKIFLRKYLFCVFGLCSTILRVYASFSAQGSLLVVFGESSRVTGIGFLSAIGKGSILLAAQFLQILFDFLLFVFEVGTLPVVLEDTKITFSNAEETMKCKGLNLGHCAYQECGPTF